MKKVGIFAGTFDPVHDGHLMFALQALQECQLDKVFFLVEPRPRRKQGVRALEHRIRMVQIAVAKERRFSTIILEQARFSVTETMPLLKELFKGAELYLLLGDDVLSHLSSWPHVNELVRDANFIVGVRDKGLDKAKSSIESLQNARGLKLNYHLLKSAAPKFASRQIRYNLKHGKEPNGLRGDVLQYIRENKLYASGDKL
jgi:nicotinate-nucleotide adenylyltransferase